MCVNHRCTHCIPRAKCYTDSYKRVHVRVCVCTRAYLFICEMIQLTCYNNDNNTDQYHPIEQPSPQCYPVGHLNVE